MPQHAMRGGAGFYLTLVASTFLMGSSFIAGKVLLQQGFSPMLLVGWRFLVASFATLPIVAFDSRSLREALFPRRFGLLRSSIVLLIGVLQTSAVMGLLFLSMRTVSASTAAILLFTNPIWVTILAAVFLGEAMSLLSGVGTLLGLFGVAMALGIGPDYLAGGPQMGGEMIGIASSLCWAVATLINKRAGLPMSIWALSFWQMFLGSLPLLAIAYACGEHWPASATRAQWAWFAWLAIPASTGSFGLWFVALSRGGAGKASSYLFLAPLFTIALALIVFHQRLSIGQAVGGALVGFALWLVNRSPRPGRPREARIQALIEGEP